MKVLSYGSLAVLNVAILLAACSPGVASIELDQTEVDIGSVVNGEIVTLEIQVSNLGEAELVIESVSTSCGCTSAEVVPAIIPPGEQGLLLIRFDSGAHGPEETGPVLRQIFIASNDPDELETEVRIRAEIMPPG
jgi:hypothetical protein